MPVANRRRVQGAEIRTPERRMNTRYPLALEMSYSVVSGARQGETGASRTVDISSSGLRFMAAHPLALGLQVEVAITWPFPLDGCIPLQLMANGLVVRSCGNETAVTLREPSFKTRRSRDG